MIELEVVIRTVASFGLLLIAERILGKQTISQMTIFDFIAAITLGAIAAGLAYNTSIKPHNMAISFSIFCANHFSNFVPVDKEQEAEEIFCRRSYSADSKREDT